jgi:hypothetical protein
MKFNITLSILAFIVLIVLYCAFSRENAKILTNKNDEFVFIDSDKLLQRMRANLNELKRVLRRDEHHGVSHRFGARIVRPLYCNGGYRGDYCGIEVVPGHPEKVCKEIVADCPEGSTVIMRGNRSCACARLVGAHGWFGGSQGNFDKINL